MFGVPPKTPYDWNFTAFGFPVRVAPWFWVAALVLSGGGGATATSVFAFAAALFISILIHELGHTFAFRYYGQNSYIVLYHFGGLAVPSGSRWDAARSTNNPWHQIVISAAGPALQMLVALALALVLRAFGIGSNSWILAKIGIVGGQLPSNEFVYQFLLQFYWVSIAWALFNLLPVYPLDGGQISRNLFLLFGGASGIANSLMLSVATGALLAFYGLKIGEYYLVFLFGSLAYGSYEALQSYGAGPRRW